MVFVGLAFWIGARMVTIYGLDKESVFLSVFAIFSAAFGVGTSLSNLPSINKAKQSA